MFISPASGSARGTSEHDRTPRDVAAQRSATTCAALRGSIVTHVLVKTVCVHRAWCTRTGRFGSFRFAASRLRSPQDMIGSTTAASPMRARFRGLELRVADSADLLPALPLWVRRHDGWEPVGHALERPSQIAGPAGAPWSRLSGLPLADEGDAVRRG